MDSDLTEVIEWRRHLHRNPELAFQEFDTSAFVRGKLAEWGFELSEPIAGTGLVASLTKGGSSRSIGLRADMDALPMQEAPIRDWASQCPGRFHACGHDGHVAMLLGAARRISQLPDLDGTVRLVFQPAEEGKGGARHMIEAGLLDTHPMDEIYAVHNWPALPLGRAAVNAGPMMAAADRFDIKFSGKGGHAAMPHRTQDTVLAAAHFTMAVQSIISRAVDPQKPAAVSVTRLEGGSGHNVIPEVMQLTGTARSFDEATRDLIETRLRQLAQAAAIATGTEVHVDYDRYYPATVNSADEARHAAAAAEGIGLDVDRMPVPSMGAEDFSFFLRQLPGAYIWLGQGDERGHAAELHSSEYDFNDDLLEIGISFFVALTRERCR